MRKASFSASFGLLVTAIMLITSPGICQDRGTVLWKVELGYTLVSSPALGSDGTIYIGLDAERFQPGRLYALSPQGKTNWIFETSAGVRASPSVGSDGSIYVGSLDGNFYAVEPSGSNAWTFPTGGSVVSSAAVGADGTIYVAAVSNYLNKLYALRPDGAAKWVCDLGAVFFMGTGSVQVSSPAIGPDGTIYVASLNTNLYALRPDGTTKWMARLDNVSYASPSIGADGTVYLGSEGEKVVAFDANGGRRWETATGWVESSAAVSADGTLYVGALDRWTYALNADGGMRWSFESGGVSVSPAVAADGTVYIAAYGGGMFYALSPSGSPRWSVAGPYYAFTFSSPVIGQDGTVYLGMGPWLYAIWGGSCLQAAPWPMFRRDPKHNARSTQCAITCPTVLSNGAFGMTLVVETGLTYRVQSSSNLTNWADLISLTPTNSSFGFADLAATNFQKRFYRLMTP